LRSITLPFSEEKETVLPFRSLSIKSGALVVADLSASGGNTSFLIPPMEEFVSIATRKKRESIKKNRTIFTMKSFLYV
jgi:hypothetical protein